MIPQINNLPCPATRSRTISPSNLATTKERYVRSIRNMPWLSNNPVSLLVHRGIMILSRLRNWCKNAILSPGFVWGGGIWGFSWPSVRPEALGGLRKSLRCASKVIGFVGCIVTLDVESPYGTKTTREPSLFFRPEFLRCNCRPCSFSAVRLLHHRRPPSPAAMIERARKRAPSSRVVFEVIFKRSRTRVA
jgi:hypothetical protein